MSDFHVEVWWGTVVDTYPGHIVISDSRWSDDYLPAGGTKVEIRKVYRSPYWSLIEDDEWGMSISQMRDALHREEMAKHGGIVMGRPIYDAENRRIG